MTENDIQEILDNLGQHVSKIAEENRVLKVREGALKELFALLSNHISAEEWVNIYESTTDIFIKDLIKDWGRELFPENY